MSDEETPEAPPAPPRVVPDRLRSRKFWVTLCGSVLVVIVSAVLDIPAEQAETAIQGIVGVVAPYLLAQGFADGRQSK